MSSLCISFTTHSVSQHTLFCQRVFSERSKIYAFIRMSPPEPSVQGLGQKDRRGDPQWGLALRPDGRFCDTFLFCGQLRELRQRTATLADIQPGDAVLDVGCGTGTLAMEVARRVGRAGRVAGIDPGTEQIVRARSKAARYHLPIEFQIGVIEQLPFPDQTFDVALSTLMMHHLPHPLKRQGLAEIARVLKPGERLVIADFKRRSDRQGQAARFHAGGAACKIWLPWSQMRVSHRWKRRRCGSHDSLLSQEQASFMHTTAKTNGRSKSWHSWLLTN
jgi:ubiquinone/menaquinone biosynthesis C-methylase UbiE